MTTLFYAPDIHGDLITLEEEESRHLLTALRGRAGDMVLLTDGKGHIYEAIVAEIGKKKAVLSIRTKTAHPKERTTSIHIAMAPVKNLERFEWFLEKATELGIDEITPLLCDRSERDTLRMDRMEKILISAIKQCMRPHLPKLNPLTKFKAFVSHADAPQKCIGWCSTPPLPFIKDVLLPAQNTVIAIGPEGDFSPAEIELALQHGFKGIGLGTARLRTETAGLLALSAAILNG